MITSTLEPSRSRSALGPLSAEAPPESSENPTRGFPINGETQRRVEALLGRMSERYRFLPSGISSLADVRQHAVVRETFRGDCYQYAICGLSDAQRKELTQALRAELRLEALPLVAVDSGDLVLIHRDRTDKGWALERFAAELGLPAKEVFKFGDQAGALGNDRAMLRDARSFNVGAEPAAVEGVHNLGRVGPEGVLATLRWLLSHQISPRAILSDFDGTLNWGESSDRPQLDFRLARLLVELARKGTRVGIVTGRGETFFRDGLSPLYQAGLDPEAAKNLSIYLFNGARPLRPAEWPPPPDHFEAPETGELALPSRTREALQQLLKKLRQAHPYLPETVSETASLSERAVIPRHFRGHCYQYVLAGMTAAERNRAVFVLRPELEKLGLAAVDTGRAVDIHPARSNKGRAVADFARRTGVPVGQIFKFGDRAGPTGNDRALLTDARSFNVGDQPSPFPEVRNLGPVGVDGVLEILCAEPPPPAIAADFDGTLTGLSGDALQRLDPRAAHRLLELARAGVPVAIITGRGTTVFPDFLEPMREAGMTPADARQFTLYLFNGARPTRYDEWPSQL